MVVFAIKSTTLRVILEIVKQLRVLKTLRRPAHRLLDHSTYGSRFMKMKNCVGFFVDETRAKGLFPIDYDYPANGEVSVCVGNPSPLLHINVQRFQGGLVFEAYGLLYHSTLDLKVKRRRRRSVNQKGPELPPPYDDDLAAKEVGMKCIRKIFTRMAGTGHNNEHSA